MKNKIESLQRKKARLENQRNIRIDAINIRQKALNEERQEIYDFYDTRIKIIDKELATLNGRSSEFSHPQKNFEQNA